MPKSPLLFDFEGSEGIQIEPHIWQNITNNAEMLKNISYKDPTTRKDIVPAVKSIPSPFARMLLFRNAFYDERFPARLKEEIAEDILDVMEFMFLIKNTKFADNVGYTSIKLNEDKNISLAKHKSYIRTLNDLAVKFANPDSAGENLDYRTIGIIWLRESAARYRVIAGTSPYTVFFTPETKIDFVNDYFEWIDDELEPGKRIRKIKPFYERNQIFLSFLFNFRYKLPPSFYHFSKWLERKFKEMEDFHPVMNLVTAEEFRFASMDNEDIDTDRMRRIEIIPGVLNYPILSDEIKIESFYKLKPALKQKANAKLPLVLTAKYTSQPYYNDLKFPERWELVLSDAVKNDPQREILPGTSQKYPWISPIDDFIEPNLIKLPLYLNSNKVHDGNKENNDVCYLIPLKKKFFEYFSPDSIEDLLKIDVESPAHDEIYKNDKVRISLTIPVEGNNKYITVNKTYNPDRINYDSFREDRVSNQLFRQGTYFSLWPSLINRNLEQYYVLLYEHTNKFDTKWKDIKFYHYENTERETILREIKDKENDKQIDSTDRDFSTRVFRLKYPPEMIYLERRTGEKGFLLPRFRRIETEGSPIEWHVGIDFGTSNTVIAFTENIREPKNIRLLGLDNHGLTDLYFSGEKKDDALQMFNKAVNSYFIPDKYGRETEQNEFEGKPFSTELVYMANEQNPIHPLLHSSITFKRVIPPKDELNPQYVNHVMTNLKWSDQNLKNKKLTDLFFKEIKEIIQSRAAGSGIDVNKIKFYYSYPLAFDEDQKQLLKGIFEGNKFNVARSYDESECTARYFMHESALFSPKNQYAVTVDVGGGTSDIVGYNRGNIMFKNSIIFGGRDLFEDESKGAKLTNPFVASLVNTIKRSSAMNQKLLNVYNEEIYKQYSDSHSIFSYIVSKDEFDLIFNDLINTEFYKYFRLAILYYYSAILYFLAVNIRYYSEVNNKISDLEKLESLNIAIAGNGSRLLEWLCRRERWEDYTRTHPYLKKFMEVLFGRAVGAGNDTDFSLNLIQSSKPKEEVVKGLLIYYYEQIENNLNYNPDINMRVGEDLVNLNNKKDISSFDEFKIINRSNFGHLEFKDYEQSHIKKFNDLWISIFNDPQIKAGLENDFKLKNIQEFTGIISGIKKTELFDLTVRTIQDYYNSRDDAEVHESDPYMNSYFITEIKACLHIIKSQLKSKYLTKEIQG